MAPFWKKKDPNVIEVTNETLQEQSRLGLIINALTNLSRAFGQGRYGISPDGKRNYNELFGYGEVLSYTDYRDMYRRGGIANTVVSKVAKACWRDNPELFAGDTQILEEELNQLRQSKFFKAMERADILNRIGPFSVLLIGVPDGQDLDQPLGSAAGADFSKLYFNPYGYDGIEILELDNEPSSERFGLPVLYRLQTSQTRKATNVKAITVHYTRIIHMAEGALESSIEGCSALEACWNALLDKDKVRGGSGEAYYRNSRQKLALEADKDAQIDRSPDALKTLKQNVENFQNGFEDTLRLDKMKANMLQPGLVSPRDPFDVCVEEISGTTGIPVRFLTTKAGGTVTGSEDKASWNALINDRQEAECTPWLADALKLLADAGMLDLPEEFEIKWPVQPSLNEKEASESMKSRSAAFKDVMEALSTIGADDVVARSVLDSLGFEDVDLSDIDFTDDEENDDPEVAPEPPTPEEE